MHLVVWRTLSFINFPGKDGTHFLKELGAASCGKLVLSEYLALLWKVGLQPLVPCVTGAKVMFVKPTAADAEAINIYAEAYSNDPEFYSFLKTLESYEKNLQKSSTVILSTDSDYLTYLKTPLAK